MNLNLKASLKSISDPASGHLPVVISHPTALPAPRAHDGLNLSRRSVVGTMLAALAPAAGTAVALPKVIGTAVAIAAPSAAAVITPSAVEAPELLALGAEVETALSAYREAAAKLVEARSTAAALWPSVPDDLIVSRADRDLWADRYGSEVDFEGNEVLPEASAIDGKHFQLPPRNVLQASPLKEFLADVEADPDDYGDGFAADLVSLVRAAELYETACARAIEASGIEDTKRAARLGAQRLYELLFEVRNHAPRTVAGVLIMARAVAAFGEARENSHWPAANGVDMGGNVMGTALADALLRVVSVGA